MVSDLEVDEFAQACNRVYALMRRNRSSLAASSGADQLSESQLALLTPLAEHGPLPVGKVATLAKVSQPTATRALKQLETHGMVRRDRSTQDDRTVLVALTPEGTAALSGAVDRMRELQRAALETLPPSRRAPIVKALTDLAKAIDQSS
ncbi:MarR family winged helix-turn-helix transcriptional regulator [Crossiella cryophila]|uniref:DNA-binding MarR family transcriptional regulator n=1 Tax=Crossiella cryophila TaxID=43355 RepID=A0A7W7CCZ4_9PSEU|nr:MarR family transcriptional regulator [Crossiella cryophila]MBB4678853.1 DNA-binding MarR family transcriptional regulator [Crossiella cryophila]